MGREQRGASTISAMAVLPARVAETGCHDVLMASNGIYATLFRTQASGYQDVVAPPRIQLDGTNEIAVPRRAPDMANLGTAVDAIGTARS